MSPAGVSSSHKSQHEAFLKKVEVALRRATSSASLSFWAILKHMWASTLQPRKVLLGNN